MIHILGKKKRKKNKTKKEKVLYLLVVELRFNAVSLNLHSLFLCLLLSVASLGNIVFHIAQGILFNIMKILMDVCYLSLTFGKMDSGSR